MQTCRHTGPLGLETLYYCRDAAKTNALRQGVQPIFSLFREKYDFNRFTKTNFRYRQIIVILVRRYNDQLMWSMYYTGVVSCRGETSMDVAAHTGAQAVRGYINGVPTGTHLQPHGD